MYLDTVVKIPDVQGKITCRSKKGTTYVEYEYAREYLPERKYTIPKRKTIAYRDNTDRITVERAFALAKHSYGLGLVTARLDETTRNTIAMSVLAMNIDRILAKRMFILWAKICGLIRTAILETIKGRKDELCMAAAY